MKNKEAFKSMFTMGITLILVILAWLAIGYIMFPEQEPEDRYAAFIGQNEGMLAQIAENAMDESKWAGIMATAEARALMEKGDIISVSGDDAGASFMLKSDIGEMRILYRPNGEYVFSHEGDWTLERSEALIKRWVGGLAGKGYVNVRRLGDQFFLEQVYIPA